jgi:glycine/D-amino acid oxidase-like deaminating enzyme
MSQVVIGAGFAGLATAYHLARRGVQDILVLERESGPGVHASGRNAGLLRQSSHDEALVPLLRAGSRAARRILRTIPGALIPTGSLILGGAIDRLHGGTRAEIRAAGEIVPSLEGPALFDPDDCIMDPQALLASYEDGARRRGVRIAYEEEVRGLATEGGEIRAVVTSLRTVPAESVILAAGAWAGELAAAAGSRDIEISSLRRHLFRGSLGGRDTSHWPFVWHEEAGVYFRPEGDGLLLSPCDVQDHPPRAPEVDPAARDLLAERLEGAFGNLGEWRVGPGWACLRTFARDDRFLIGPDPGIAGLFWVGALGGHGVTTSWAVGRLAAEVFLGRADPGPFAPARFRPMS